MPPDADSIFDHERDSEPGGAVYGFEAAAPAPVSSTTAPPSDGIQFAYAKGEKVVGFNTKGSEAFGLADWVWFNDDEYRQFNAGSEQTRQSVIQAAQARVRQNPDSNVPWGRVHVGDSDGGGIDPAESSAQREQNIERAIAGMGSDDGDSLPAGHYEDDEFGSGLRRIGDVEEPLERYHGSAQKPGAAIGEFVMIPPNYEHDPRVNLNRLPSLYVTPNQSLAEMHAGKGEEDSEGNRLDPQLYDVVITPNEVVDLGDCSDDEEVRKAAEAGADVIECPDYDEGHETVILDPDVTHIREVRSLNTGKALPIPAIGAADNDALREALSEYGQSRENAAAEGRERRKYDGAPAALGGLRGQGVGVKQRRGRGQGQQYPPF